MTGGARHKELASILHTCGYSTANHRCPMCKSSVKAQITMGRTDPSKFGDIKYWCPKCKKYTKEVTISPAHRQVAQNQLDDWEVEQAAQKAAEKARNKLTAQRAETMIHGLPSSQTSSSISGHASSSQSSQVAGPSGSHQASQLLQALNSPESNAIISVKKGKKRARTDDIDSDSERVPTGWPSTCKGCLEMQDMMLGVVRRVDELENVIYAMKLAKADSDN